MSYVNRAGTDRDNKQFYSFTLSGELLDVGFSQNPCELMVLVGFHRSNLPIKKAHLKANTMLDNCGTHDITFNELESLSVVVDCEHMLNAGDICATMREKISAFVFLSNFYSSSFTVQMPYCSSIEDLRHKAVAVDGDSLVVNITVKKHGSYRNAIKFKEPLNYIVAYGPGMRFHYRLVH